jgi:hypothetical protein
MSEKSLIVSSGIPRDQTAGNMAERAFPDQVPWRPRLNTWRLHAGNSSGVTLGLSLTAGAYAATWLRTRFLDKGRISILFLVPRSQTAAAEYSAPWPVYHDGVLKGGFTACSSAM